MRQTKRSLTLIYAVNPFGADHESSEHDPSYASYPEHVSSRYLLSVERVGP